MNKDTFSRRCLLQRASGLAAGALIGSALASNPAHAAEPAANPARKKRTLLAIGAHLDDPEIGAGGVIAKAVRNGHRVVVEEMKYALAVFRGYQSGTRFAEGFKALDPAVLGQRVLQEVVS